MRSRREYIKVQSLIFVLTFLMMSLAIFLIYAVLLNGEIVTQSDVIRYDEDES